MQTASFRTLACVAALGVGLTAHAGGPRTVLLELAPLDQEVPRSVTGQLSQTLAADLDSSFALVPAAEVDALRSGSEKTPDVSAAVKVLGEAKEQLTNMQLKQAFKSVAAARAILDPLRAQLRDYGPLTTALLYNAVVAMNLGDKRTSAAAFADLARLRPDYRIDPAEFPPAVLDAFEKARSAEVKLPRGRMVVSSTPIGAQVYVDEVVKGTTPLTVPASPGAHVVRLSLAGHLSWTKNVAVESYGKHELAATLEKNAPSEALQKVESGAVSGAIPAGMTAPAAAVAAALEADAVVVGIVALSVKGYVITAAWLPRSGAAHVMAIELGRTLENEKAVIGKLAAALAGAPNSKSAPTADGALVVHLLGDGKLSRAPDFAKFALGFKPGGAAAVLAEAARAPTGMFNGPGQQVVEKQPSRWYLWVGAAVLVAGAAGAATGIYFATRPPSGVQFVLQRQP